MDTNITLRQGTIDYRDEGAGDPLVFVHGLLVDGRLWRKVTPRLRTRIAASCPTGRSARTTRRSCPPPTARRAASRI